MTNPYESPTVNEGSAVPSRGPVSHQCPNCGSNQIANCWRSFMTGLGSGDATCSSCRTRLCLGPTPRVIAYATMFGAASMTAVLMTIWIWLIGDVRLAESLALVVIALVAVIPISLWLAYFVRGVIISPRNRLEVSRGKAGR